MKPIRLELEGFTSFRQRTVLDFANLELFAICGPTGAGKSSLIDGILYALYGRTPRLSEKNTQDLVSQGAPRMTVVLEFSANGDRYQIARSMKQGGPVTVRLEKRDSDDWKPLSSKTADVKKLVPEILGLDYEAFTKSVVLPQGEFDRFLRGAAEDRRVILKNLLNLKIYETMSQRAFEKAKADKQSAQLIEDDLQSVYREATEENRAAIASELDQAHAAEAAKATELQRVREALPFATALREAIAAASAAQADVTSAKYALAASQRELAAFDEEEQQRTTALARLEKDRAALGFDADRYRLLNSLRPLAVQRAAVAKDLGEARRQLAECEENRSSLAPMAEANEKSLAAAAMTVEAAQKRLEQKTKERQEQPAPELIRAALSEVRERPQLEARLAKAKQAIAEIGRQETELETALAGASAQEQSEAEALRSASEALDRARTQHAAAALRAHLHASEACPVCEQTVTTLPVPIALDELDAARQSVGARQSELDAAKARVAKIRASLEALPQQRSAIEDQAKTVADAIARCIEKIGRLPSEEAELLRLQEKVTKLDAAVAAAQRDYQTQVALEKQVRETAAEQRRELDRLDQQIEHLQESRKKRTAEQLQLDEALAGYWDIQVVDALLREQESAAKQASAIDVEITRHQDALQRLATNAQELLTRRAVLEDRIAQAEAKALAAEGRRADSAQAVAERLAALSLESVEELLPQEQRLATQHRQMQLQIGTLANRLKEIERKIGEAADKRAQAKEFKQRGERFQELRNLLVANQFPTYVSEEALRRLAADGTERLHSMSSGRYSFAAEANDFLVIDHWNADERRPVATLSGGESFFASLALALALAGSISRFQSGDKPVRLETLFLDEGFSTLDPETLDVVIEGIEGLQQEARMVGVISHVAELATRLPARIEVRKAIGGSTLEVVVGG